MKEAKRVIIVALAILAAGCLEQNRPPRFDITEPALSSAGEGGRTSVSGGLRFEISYDESVRPEPITGRVYVIVTQSDRRPPVAQVGETGVPFFGRNIDELIPGQAIVIDGDVVGYPVASLNDLPPGEYFVQAFVNVYTRFDRTDGHRVWLHMDQWEGQRWRRSPGNLFSTPRKVTLDPEAGEPIRLVCDNVIPPIELPEDTAHVKRFRMQSRILTNWWGRPMYVGATVLLPRGYDDHSDTLYPVNYIQGHFSTRTPGGFGRRRTFDDIWLADGTPRFVYVTFQHPTPYYDDSYAVNSANNGPYADALMQELIPEIERRFRVIRESWGRVLSGGSTGGWEAVALQVFQPDSFGGCFASCPDPLDFRYHQIVNIYEDDNAYWFDRGWTRVERPNRRSPDGNVRSMMKDENLFELTVGDKSRSGGQWDIWEAAFGPVGEDGYPQRIWDKRTGTIDHEVAAYWKEHFDLRHILATHWDTLGAKLVGKLHIYVGDMDSYYLNEGVRLMEEFLESTKDPYYAGVVKYGRRKPHCWGPRGAELLELMKAQVEKQAPPGTDFSPWQY